MAEGVSPNTALYRPAKRPSSKNPYSVATSVTVAGHGSRVAELAAHAVKPIVDDALLRAHPADGVEGVAQTALAHADQQAETGDRKRLGALAKELFCPGDNFAARLISA